VGKILRRALFPDIAVFFYFNEHAKKKEVGKNKKRVIEKRIKLK
jgi:hypothetical protein